MQLKAIGKCRNLQLEKNVKANLPKPSMATILPLNNTFNIRTNDEMVKVIIDPMSDGGNRTHQDNHQLIALILFYGGNLIDIRL